MLNSNPRSNPLWLLSVILLLITTACGKTTNVEVSDSSAVDPEPTAAVAEQPAAAPEPVETSTAAATEPVAEASTTETVDEAESTVEVFLALDVAGIQAVNAQTGSINNIVFESDIAVAQTVATNVLGDPQETVENGECPAGPLSITAWPNGFALIASEGQFVGWSLNPISENYDLTTVGGIGIGSSREELEAIYAVDVFESTLGMEFNSGQLSGLLSTEGYDAVITDLWAGTVCNFR